MTIYYCCNRYTDSTKGPVFTDYDSCDNFRDSLVGSIDYIIEERELVVYENH